MMLEGDYKKYIPLAVERLRRTDDKGIKIGDYTVKFKYADVKTGECLVEKKRIFTIMDLSAYRVNSITLDVYGLNKNSTEITIYKELLIVFPKRDPEEIKKFILELDEGGSK